MKKIYLTLLMSLWIFSSPAQISQVDDMEEVFDYFSNSDSKTLAIFDVDMVLVQPSDPAFQMANMKRFSTTLKRIMKEIPYDKQSVFLNLITLSSDPVLIDARTPQFLQKLMQDGVPVMALTANLTGQVGKEKKIENRGEYG